MEREGGGQGLGHFRSAGISLGLALPLTSSTFVRMSVKCQNKSNADKNFIACQKCLRKKRKSAAGGCFSSHIFLFALHLSLLLTLMLYQMSRLEYFSLLEFACGTSATQQTPRQVATCSRDLTQNKFMLNRTIATAAEAERERVEQRDRYFV